MRTPWGEEHPALSIESTMLRANAVLRVVMLLDALTLAVVRPTPEHPVGAAVVMGVLTLWSCFAIWAYSGPRRRRAPLLVADLAVLIGAILVTPLIKGPDWQATMPGFLAIASVLAWSIHWRLPGGLVAGVLMAVADLVFRPEITDTNVGNVFILLIGGPIVGFLSGLLQQLAEQRDRAERAAAAAAERQRLARVVHDGVLQVLALVQRRGTEIGGEAVELARLAGEQESALRSFVQQDRGTAGERNGLVDLVGELRRLQSGTVSVATPGGQLRIPAAQADEVGAVVAACLTNVRQHAGVEARAWVLLEDLGERWSLTVRDDGPGIPEGRLEAAQAQGRLGVAESIRGRIADLGGTAALVTGPGQGTEWEFGFVRTPTR